MKRRLRLPAWSVLLPSILALALLARLVFAAWAYPRRWNLDPDLYDGLAMGVLQHGELSSPELGVHSVFREPGWPLLLALGYAVGGHGIGGVLALQLPLALGGIALLAALARRFVSETTAVLAALIAAVHPVLVYYTVQPFREVAYLFFGLVFLWELLRAVDKPRPSSFAWAGAAGAWTGLISTTFLPFAAAAPLALKYFRRKLGLKLLAAYYIALAAVYSPWPIRNYVHWHAFIPGTLYAAENVWRVMILPHEVRATETEAVLTRTDPTWKAWNDVARTDPGKANAILSTAIRERLKEDPLAILRHVPFHAWKLWRPFPYRTVKAAVPEGPAYGALFWASVLSDGWIIPLGFLGAVLLLYRRGGPDLFTVLGALWIVLLTAVHAASFAMTRHRVPVMGLMIVFASALLVRALEGESAWPRES